MQENGNPLFDEVKTNKTLKNIKLSLSKSLLDKYGVEDNKVIDTILKIHGLHKDNFDFVSNIAKIINEKLNDVSIDANSNKSDKTIESISQENISPVKKLIGFDYLYRVMKESYGKEEANRLIGEILDLSLGLSDSTNILKPYCWSLDASKIVTIGREFGQLHSKPCKRVSSYISALCETVHQLSNHLAGAIAIGSFFLDIAHLCIFKHKYTIEDLENNEIRKTLENEFQQFVHSVNHLSRNSNESPFTNLSIFDREKLRTLIKQYDWYFDNKTGSDDFLEFVVEFIIKLQDIYLDFFDKGNPSENGLPYRFPVCTINISKVENGKVKIPDEKFLKDICNRDIYRYNIFTSEGTKIASCCRLISNTEMMELASQANSFGGVGVSLGSHRVVTINFNRIAVECKTYDDYFNILSKRIDDAGKILSSHKQLLKILTEKGLQMFIEKGWIQLNRMFSTFGMLGVYEAALLLKEKFNIDNETDIIKDILVFFNKKVSEISDKYKIIGNIEQIPGESFASRLANADKILFGEEIVPYQLYSNQFVPLWEDATVWERMEIDGKYNKLITGGGIVHAMIGERVTPLQAEELIKYAISCGCEHFALNAVYSQCENSHTSFGKNEICPICGAKIIDYLTRVVGFFVPVSNWDKVRRTWEFERRTFIK